jgi:hypothetical protein
LTNSNHSAERPQSARNGVIQKRRPLVDPGPSRAAQAAVIGTGFGNRGAQTKFGTPQPDEPTARSLREQMAHSARRQLFGLRNRYLQ